MRKILLLLLTIVLLINCKEENTIDDKYVIAKFQENSDKINKLAYKIHRIDSFPQRGGTVWNNTGIALIEKDAKDKIFGFSFYGKRDDVAKEYIYDAGNGFEISKDNKTYKIEKGSYGFIGKPGGQMIPENIFDLDSVYKKVTLTKNERTYLLTYEFENDTVYNVTDIVKTVELNKDDFFPIKIKRTYNQLGNKTVSQTVLSDVKTNENVKISIKKLKLQFKDFTIIQPEKHVVNKLLNKKLPFLSLPDLFDETKIVSIKTTQLTLLDFWEVWCGPCIASFPKVEELKNKYASELNVIGIVSEDKENAIKLVKKKGTTFINLIGNDELKETFSVNSWPRYFLIDTNGIIQKEYHGFSQQIETDIKKMIAE